MKYLYIDESIDEKHFAVEGILCDSEKDMLLAYNRLKKQISRIPLTSRVKERINYEFKSSLLDRSYPKIKKKMLYKLNAFDCQVVYSCRNINGTIIQKEKESLYIDLLSRILNYIDDKSINVVFDSFGNRRFENDIIRAISKTNRFNTIGSDFSFNNKGLQFADNVCGTIRKHLSNSDIDDFYEIISKKTIKIPDK
ncbi:MAG: DUF3800 domain-containing protein [Erysipelotrichaceae bacterium]|nr:DUF3800 domain-containing protein [Erysipelotrichaceae bacterium]